MILLQRGEFHMRNFVQELLDRNVAKQHQEFCLRLFYLIHDFLTSLAIAEFCWTNWFQIIPLLPWVIHPLLQGEDKAEHPQSDDADDPHSYLP